MQNQPRCVVSMRIGGNKSTQYDLHLHLHLHLQSFTLQQIVLRGIMQCCRLVGTEFSAWIGTVGD